MKLEELIAQHAAKGVNTIYGAAITADDIQLQSTNDNFEGDITIVAFALSRAAKKAPPVIAEELGNWLQENVAEVAAYNVVKGFLNVVMTDAYWLEVFTHINTDENYGYGKPTGELRMVEYSSPNTNKPLHVGHLRNNFLGYSVAEILKAVGHDVAKVQIINDRGIHICMSMLAWERFGEGETPESSGLKGDKLVGKYYVRFNTEMGKQGLEMAKDWEAGDTSMLTEKETGQFKAARTTYEASAKSDDDLKAYQSALKSIAKPYTQILEDAREMLRKWENKDPETVALWKKMNQWVYNGFDISYHTMGVDFDKLYYESETFLIGKKYVLEGVEKGIFYQKEDGSVWVDLTAHNLDHKLLLRADGTAVYMTQDIGTAILRFEDYPGLTQQIYTVGDEQEYHFKVLFIILEMLGFKQAANNYHLSYGMVDLPKGMGRMKSREGKVVDADNLMDEVIQTAKERTLESDKLTHIPEEERDELFRIIGVGAIKYFLLRVDPKKRMVYNPKESVALQGNTGPFIQYAYARTQSILEKYGKTPSANHQVEMAAEERNLIQLLSQFPAVVKEAADNYSPATIANYAFEVAKQYGTFYNAVHVLKAENETLMDFRAALCAATGKVIERAIRLLGMEVPEKM